MDYTIDTEFLVEKLDAYFEEEGFGSLREIDEETVKYLNGTKTYAKLQGGFEIEIAEGVYYGITYKGTSEHYKAPATHWDPEEESFKMKLKITKVDLYTDEANIESKDMDFNYSFEF